RRGGSIVSTGLRVLSAIAVPLLALFLLQTHAPPAHSQTAAEQWSIGYWTPWGNPPASVADMDWDGITHVIHFGALITFKGTVDVDSLKIAAKAPALIAAAHANGVKVLLGLVQYPNEFPQAIANNRAALIDNIMQ